jgi:predicted GIY-YIG superfamily endonuclease
VHVTLYVGVTNDLSRACGKREWKLNLIEQHNPDWQDLTENL